MLCVCYLQIINIILELVFYKRIRWRSYSLSPLSALRVLNIEESSAMLAFGLLAGGTSVFYKIVLEPLAHT
jgi:hypothetical protein